MTSQTQPITGAHIIARTLKDLGITVVFGLVGVPVSDIAEQAINLGIRFIGFRNEQAASYAASGYGYLTGRPGVCLVVGGPGVLHAVAGVGNASENNFPLLLLGGSIETHQVTKGAFQEMDSLSLLTSRTKMSIRAPNQGSLPSVIANAYRCSFYGRPGPTFVDLPADIINDTLESEDIADIDPTPSIADAPKSSADEKALRRAVGLIQNAKAPLILTGKGASYARAELPIRQFIDTTHIPFLPSPMGKGVVPDSHPQNASSARSAALKMADVVLIIGARLNWIFHYGEAPKWNPNAKFIQVDISPEEMGRNAAASNSSVFLLGDVGLVTEQLLQHLGSWSYRPTNPSKYLTMLASAKQKNETVARKATMDSTTPLTYARAFHIIKSCLHKQSPPSEGNIVYIAEGANTMDISRSIFPLEHPRLRMDAGSFATMGVGLPYAIAAWEAYNAPTTKSPSPTRPSPSIQKNQKKKIVLIQGDSAHAFTSPELETLSRHSMSSDMLVFILNNNGIYFGDSPSLTDFEAKQRNTATGNPEIGLRSWALGWEVRYEKWAEGCGGKGYFVRTEEELWEAARRGYEEGNKEGKLVVVNVVIGSAGVEKQAFGWQVAPRKKKKNTKENKGSEARL